MWQLKVCSIRLAVFLIAVLASYPTLSMELESKDDDRLCQRYDLGGEQKREIYIYRLADSFRGGFVPMVFIDGKPVKDLKAGECIVLEVSVGGHELWISGNFPSWTKNFDKKIVLNNSVPVTFVGIEPVFKDAAYPSEADVVFTLDIDLNRLI